MFKKTNMETRCGYCSKSLDFPIIFEDPIQQLIEEFIGIRYTVTYKCDCPIHVVCIKCDEWNYGIPISRKRIIEIAKDRVLRCRELYSYYNICRSADLRNKEKARKTEAKYPDACTYLRGENGFWNMARNHGKLQIYEILEKLDKPEAFIKAMLPL